MAHMTVEEFTNFFTYFKGEPHQKAAVEIMYGQMHAGLLEDSHAWVKTYRQQIDKPEVVADNPLDVPYQSQLDNASGTGYRECFSSSCAMVAMYYGKVENDDAYNLIRQKYGDSTDPAAQVQALRELGLEARFVTNGTTFDLKRCIDEGRPVPVGWLHKGPVSAPTGGGHWSVVVGYTDSAWIINDPNGEANLVSGGYVNNSAGSQSGYSYKNWNPRWIVAGEGDGWYLDVINPAKK